MSLVNGSPLMIEDLDVTMRVTLFKDPISHGIHKYKGKVSKRRFNNIMKMRYKRHYDMIKNLVDKCRNV